MESANENTFVNFSAFLGHPDNVHFQPRPSKPNPTTAPRKKSEYKIKCDNDLYSLFPGTKEEQTREQHWRCSGDHGGCSRPHNKHNPLPRKQKVWFLISQNGTNLQQTYF